METKVTLSSKSYSNFPSRLCASRVNNFSRDVQDGENYTILLNQLKPNECSRAPLQTKDLKQRAEEVSCHF